MHDRPGRLRPLCESPFGHDFGEGRPHPAFSYLFELNRDYVASNDPPEKDRYQDYKFSYDLASVPDGVVRAAIRGELFD